MGKMNRKNNMPGYKLHISSTVKIVILDLLGRTSAGEVPAQQHSDTGSSRRGPPFEKSHHWKALLTSTMHMGGWWGCWVLEEGSTHGDGEPLGDGPAAAVSGEALRAAALHHSPVA